MCMMLFTGSPSVTDATVLPNSPSLSHSITVTCTIHPESTADQSVVMLMADGRVTKTGITTCRVILLSC